MPCTVLRNWPKRGVDARRKGRILTRTIRIRTAPISGFNEARSGISNVAALLATNGGEPRLLATTGKITFDSPGLTDRFLTLQSEFIVALGHNRTADVQAPARTESDRGVTGALRVRRRL